MSSRLLTFPNVLVTGHQAFFTVEALEAIATMGRAATIAAVRIEKGPGGATSRWQRLPNGSVNSIAEALGVTVLGRCLEGAGRDEEAESAMVEALDGQMAWQLMAMLIVVKLVAVNLTLGSFIEPRILGRELNLSPLVVVVSVVVWGGLWGVVGGFLEPLEAVGVQLGKIG